MTGFRLCLRRPAEHPDRGRLAPRRSGRDKEAVEFRDKQRGACARNRRNLGKPRITVAAHLQNIDDAFAAADIDSLPLGIDKEVGGGVAGLRFRDDPPARAGERDEGRRLRNTVRTRFAPGSTAIGKFPRSPPIGTERTAALGRSTTATSRESGTLTQICVPLPSIWKPSG